MVLRIAVGAFAALRAVLIYGEAAELATRPLHPPRIRRAQARLVPSGRRVSVPAGVHRTVNMTP
jgi:hypothetical protein